MAKQNSSKIIRSVNVTKNNFTPISNELLQNTKLSLEAKGLISFLVSLPNDWIIYKGQVQRALDMGDTKFDRVWKECVDAGYICVSKARTSEGRFIYDYTISDNRITTVGKSTYGKPTTIQKTEEENKEEQKKYKQKSSSSTEAAVQTPAEILYEKFYRNEITKEELLKGII